MKLIPLNDKVLVLPVTVQKVSPGGIVIPETAEGKPTRGMIVACGPKVQEKLALKAGSEVMFPAYAGVEVYIDNVKHRLIPAEELLGVVEGS